MKYTVLFAMVIMGIKALLSRKRTQKTTKDETNIDEPSKSELLSSLNLKLNEMYHELTKHQDEFELKRQGYNKIQEELQSKKCEVENRLQYLEGIRNNIGLRFQQKPTTLYEFRELCKNFVSTHDDIEQVQTAIHDSEVELEEYFKSWNAELLEHNNKVSFMRREIEFTLAEISKLNGCDKI